MRIPIVPRFEPCVSPGQRFRAEALARQIQREQPHVNGGSDVFRHLVVRQPVGDEPALHLDDYSEIPVIGDCDTAQLTQQRARLRAADGDWVVQSRKIENGFSDYCEYQLGLGRVTWIYPVVQPAAPRQMALQCWMDRRVRHDLVQAVRRQGLRYIHPYVSTLHVWELAALLRNATRLPMSVIGPPPALARWANDKIEFTRVAARLLGHAYVPRTEVAFNFATLSQQVRELARCSVRLGIKFPFGVGGSGNFLLEARCFRGLSLAQVRQHLKVLLSGNRWPQSGRLLIDVWESDVVSSPSVQIWIPPAGHGDPRIEGLFDQITSGERGAFEGACTLHLPRETEREMIDCSFLLAILFQQLGYVGRCSFDLILQDSGDPARCLKFIECNGRWGGTSIPMTLVNRLHTGQASPSWCCKKIRLAGRRLPTFAQLVRRLDTELFDIARGTGPFILYNPARIRAESAVEAIALGDTPAEARHRLDFELPARLRETAGPEPGAGLDSQSIANPNL